MATMKNTTYMSNSMSRKGRQQQLLDAARPTTDWEAKLLEGHVHRLLNLAAAEGNWERVHGLLNAGARVVASENEADSEEGWTLLHHIVQGEALHGDERDAKLLEKLLSRKAVRDAINHCNDDGETALYLAVQQSDMDDACVALIKHGARIDGSRKATFGPHAGELKKAEWQFLIDKPWDKPKTVAAYIHAQATNAKQAAHCIETLAVAGMSRSISSVSRIHDVLGWLEPALAVFGSDPDGTEAMRREMRSVALRYLRWCTLGDSAIAKDVWMAERAPLMLRLLDAFDQAGGCDIWTAGPDGRPLPLGLAHEIGLPELAAELERLLMLRQTAERTSTPSPRL